MMQDQLLARNQPNGPVEIVWNHVVDEVLGDESGVTGL